MKKWGIILIGLMVAGAGLYLVIKRAEPPLYRDALFVIDRIHQQEKQKDATCWSTVRSMEQFVSKSPQTIESTLLKIETLKILTFRLWEKASYLSPSSALDPADVLAVIPEDVRQKFDWLNLTDYQKSSGIEAARNYHQITENWRTILSIMTENVGGVGLFSDQKMTVKPMTKEGYETLAKFVTISSIELLKSAADAAGQSRSSHILPEHVKIGYRDLASRWQLDDEAERGWMASSSFHPRPYSASHASRSRLMNLTRKNAAYKVKSLEAWNLAGDWDPAKAQERLGLPLPVTKEAFVYVQNELRFLATFVAKGFVPNRRDTARSNMFRRVRRPDFEMEESASFLGLPHVVNVLEQIFPVYTEPNGDVVISRLYNPYITTMKETEKPETLILEHWECDAMRDTVLHWNVINDVWSESSSQPLDPFAAELLSERLSEYATYLLKESARLAVEANLPVINGEWVLHIIKDKETNFTRVTQENKQWPAQMLETKRTLFNQYSPPFFKDVTKQSGLPLTTSREKLPESFGDFVGAGVAVGDVNNDGLEDLYLPGDGGNRLFINKGDFTFKDETKRAGIIDPIVNDLTHSLFVDLNNDGQLDLVSIHSQTPSRVFIQTGNGTFEDRSDASGIKTVKGASVAFCFDYDNDGDLDLYIGGYNASEPYRVSHSGDSDALKNIPNFTPIEAALDGRNGAENQLYENDGNARFTLVTDEKGAGSTGFTMAGAAFDYNWDGLTDFYLSNDFGRDEFFVNKGPEGFEEIGRSIGLDDGGSGMNAEVVDINGDGFWDVYTTVIDMFSKNVRFIFPKGSDKVTLDERVWSTSFYLSGNKLFVFDKEDNRFYSREHHYFEPGDKGWGWSANFFDFENDGDADIIIANGWSPDSVAGEQHNQFYLREGDHYFKSEYESDESFLGNSRGIVTADLNNDGLEDMVVSNYLNRPHLLKNVGPSKGNWVKIQLKGVRSNSFGVGAVIKITLPDGSTQMQLVSAGNHYLSQDSYRRHFGIGKNKTVSQIDITWPGGRKQTVTGPIKVNRILEVEES